MKGTVNIGELIAERDELRADLQLERGTTVELMRYRDQLEVKLQQIYEAEPLCDLAISNRHQFVVSGGCFASPQHMGIWLGTKGGYTHAVACSESFVHSLCRLISDRQDTDEANKLGLAALKRLKKLFFDYARHDWDCDHDLKSCDCGFEKALAEVNGQKP